MDHSFLPESADFFFLDFKNMVVKGIFTISGGEKFLIQHGYQIVKQFHLMLVECMGVSFKITLFKTTFKNTKLG